MYAEADISDSVSMFCSVDVDRDLVVHFAGITTIYNILSKVPTPKDLTDRYALGALSVSSSSESSSRFRFLALW
jgi:hypothetical protein